MKRIAVTRYGVKLKLLSRLDLRLAEGLDDPEEPDERRVLLQADEVVQERRDHPADRLAGAPRSARAFVCESPRERAAAAWLGCTESIPAR